MSGDADLEEDVEALPQPRVIFGCRVEDQYHERSKDLRGKQQASYSHSSWVECKVTWNQVCLCRCARAFTVSPCSMLPKPVSAQTQSCISILPSPSASNAASELPSLQCTPVDTTRAVSMMSPVHLLGNQSQICSFSASARLSLHRIIAALPWAHCAPRQRLVVKAIR